MIPRFRTCDFCRTVYDMEMKPKPLLVETKGPMGQVAICKSCIANATALVRQDLGPDWPKKKEPK